MDRDIDISPEECILDGPHERASPPEAGQWRIAIDIAFGLYDENIRRERREAFAKHPSDQFGLGQRKGAAA